LKGYGAIDKKLIQNAAGAIVIFTPITCTWIMRLFPMQVIGYLIMEAISATRLFLLLS
jgi:hypothetical protein